MFEIAPKREEASLSGGLYSCETGGDLLSQGESAQVPSAQLDLTSVFEMGTGVTPALSLPRLICLDNAVLFNCQSDRPRADGELFRKVHLLIPKDSIASTNTQMILGISLSTEVDTINDLE